MEFRNETPKKLQDHLGKCKEAWPQRWQLTWQPPEVKVARRRRHSWRHLPPPANHFSVVLECLDASVYFSKSQGGRAPPPVSHFGDVYFVDFSSLQVLLICAK